MRHPVARYSVILDQPGSLLCLHGLDEAIFWHRSNDVGTMVVSDIDESEWRCFCSGAVEEDQRWEDRM